MRSIFRLVVWGIAAGAGLAACSSGGGDALPDGGEERPDRLGKGPHTPSDAGLADAEIVTPNRFAAVIGTEEGRSGQGTLSFLNLTEPPFLTNPVFEARFCSPQTSWMGDFLHVANTRYCDSLQRVDPQGGTSTEIDLNEGRSPRSPIVPVTLFVSDSPDRIYILSLTSSLYLYDGKTGSVSEVMNLSSRVSGDGYSVFMSTAMAGVGGRLYIGMSDLYFGIPAASRLAIVNPETDEIDEIPLPHVGPIAMAAHQASGRLFVGSVGLTSFDSRLIGTGGLACFETENRDFHDSVSVERLGGEPRDIELSDEVGFLLLRRLRTIDTGHRTSAIRRFRIYPFRLENEFPIYEERTETPIYDMEWDRRIERLLIGKRSKPAGIVLLTSDGTNEGTIPISALPPVKIETPE
ncbi:MAG: hypothetical protein HYY44_02210 [Deltaproteobacteria bacterium]|nr:hypothetical protein [Deltaproteobacteria bacterium]